MAISRYSAESLLVARIGPVGSAIDLRLGIVDNILLYNLDKHLISKYTHD